MSVIEWNNLDTDIRSSESIGAFLKNILAFIRQTPNFTSNCHNPKGLKVLTPLRLVLSHLREHKLKRSFHDTLSPWCNCGNGNIEICCHFHLHYSKFCDERLTLLSLLTNDDTTILQQNDADSPGAESSKKWYLAPVGGQNIIKIFSSLTMSIF